MTPLDHLNPHQHMIYRAIERAAQRGEPCPKNDALCGMIGAASPATVSYIVKGLEQLGLIMVERFGMGRDVRFPSGLATAPWPGNRTTHWRLREGAEKKHYGGRRASPVAADTPRLLASQFVDRDPCPRCGVRRDVGCAHGRAGLSMGAFP